jgi:hypothetical protein
MAPTKRACIAICHARPVFLGVARITRLRCCMQELERVVGLVGGASVPLQLKAPGNPPAEPVLLDSMELRSLQGRPLQAWGVEAMPIDSPSGEGPGWPCTFVGRAY